MLKGVVRRAGGGRYEIDTEEGVFEAVLRGRLKLEERVGDRVVVGDHVEIAEPGGQNQPWTIEAVEERGSALLRRAPGKAPRPKVIVANVDQVMIVFAVARPKPHLRMLDRFLVLCESSGLEPVIVANKVDISGLEAAHSLFGLYERIGYRVLYTAAATGEGVEALRENICGKVSALTGPSGVGKSSLLNRVQPGLGLRVGRISEAVQKGRHTTVTAELIALDCGGYVADTPGLRELGLWGVDEAELGLSFPEFEPYLGRCRYANSCTHSHEPECAVIAAVKSGEIAESRYDSYLRLLKGEEEDG
ncbi:MAG TPA: ribosome small subunit-dependent GTPase A [Longimicrobiaceae bacterium]|nr:ribosome small subunit-dependent GTPase A [Longimicrobiaceae bacterium]